MSWLDRVKNSLTITCADGKVYTPNWMNAVKELEWNVAEFDFPETDGTLVKKSKKRGSKYNLELYFQGEFHLDVSAAFEKSLNDSRPIFIAHPFYGSLTVQAPKFTVDNSGYNVSKWTGTVTETITEANPVTTIDPVDAIAIQKNLLDETFAQALLAPVSPTDVIAMKVKAKSIFNFTVPIIKIPTQVAGYFNLFNKASTAINSAIASPLLAMRTLAAMITEPAKFALSVKQRISNLTDEFNTLRADLTGLFSPGSKQIYQNLAGTVVSSMCLASSVPLPGDFTNSTRALEVVNTLVNTYNQYISDLDFLQTPTGGSPDSFVPDAKSLIALSQLVNLAVSNLFAIALTSRVERSIITDKDTNWILLTHRFYGLDEFDNNIAELMENNNLGLNGILQIKKGTKIVYYI